MSGSERTIADLIALDVRIRDEVRTALFQAADTVRRTASETKAWKDRTGYARASVRHVDKAAFHQMVQAGGRLAPHVRFLEYGTAPHIIEARRAKMLRFIQAGAVRYAKRVRHPGTKPTHFMKDARDACAPVARELVIDGINRAIR